MKAKPNRKPKSPPAQDVSEQAKPQPTQNTGTIEAQRAALFNRLAEAYEETVKSTGEAIGKTITVLMFIKLALRQDDALESLVLHTKDGDIPYCNAGHGIEEILEWLCTELHDCWNDVDKTDIGLTGEIRLCKAA